MKRAVTLSESDSDDDFQTMENFFSNFMSSYNVLFFNNRSPNQQIKPMDITLMNRKLKMKFYVKDKKRH